MRQFTDLQDHEVADLAAALVQHVAAELSLAVPTS